MKQIIIILIIAALAYTAVTFFGSDDDYTNDENTSHEDETTNAVTGGDAGAVTTLATAFLATLDADQLAEVQLDYSLETAQNWSNLPQGGRVERVGIATGGLSTEQMAAFVTLMQTVSGSMSGEGWDEVKQIMNSDDYLGEIEGGPYGSDNYYLAFLGTPSDTDKWQLQFGGHHLAVSSTYENGVLTGSTPSFIAVEPYAEFEQNGTSNQPMVQEVNAFAAVLASLSEEELATAQLDETFTDIIAGPGADDAFPDEQVGLLVGSLTDEQQDMITTAIGTYVYDINDTDAGTILDAYVADYDNTYIAFSGTTDMTAKNDYFRVDGPAVWIEYSMQGGVVLEDNHPHSVWRDKNSDYGG